jgi:hypothetical protein
VKYLEVNQVVDIPLLEVSALGYHTTGAETGVVVAIGDGRGVLAISSVKREGQAWRIQPNVWRTIPIQGTLRTESQWEGAAIDGAGRTVLLREAPAELAVVDYSGAVVARGIHLTLPPGHALADVWKDPASGPEGVVLLGESHVLITREKEPAAIIEFAGSVGDKSHAVRGQWLPQRTAWSLPDNDLVAVATWFLADEATALGDISDAAVGPEGSLYLLSDRSAKIARVHLGALDKLSRFGIASAQRSWRLGEEREEWKDAEGLAILPDGTALVALDRKKARKNLLVLERLL